MNALGQFRAAFLDCDFLMMNVDRSFAMARVALVLLVSGMAPTWWGRDAHADEFRTWTDSTGQFSIEATLIEQVGSTVRLKRQDGATLELPLDRLSASDQQFLRDSGADNPFRIVSGPSPPVVTTPMPTGASPTLPPDRPIAASGMASAPRAPSPPPRVPSRTVPSVDGPPRTTRPHVGLQPIVWSDVQGFASGFEANFESLAIEPPAPGRTLTVRPIALPSAVEPFHDTLGLAIDSASGTAVAAVSDGPMRQTRFSVSLVDLVAGKAAKPIAAPVETKFVPLAWDAETSRLIVSVSTERFGTGPGDATPTVQVWSVTETDVTTQAIYDFPDSSHGPMTKWEWGSFLADGRFALLSFNGRLAIWDANGQVIGSTVLDLAGSSRAAASPDGRYVAVTSRRGVRILSVADLQFMSTVGRSDGLTESVAFSPDGTKLLIGTRNATKIYSTQTGEVITSLPVGSFGRDAWGFADADRVWIGGTLYDIPTGLNVYQIQASVPHTVATVAGGATWFFVKDPSKRARAIVPVPAFPNGTARKLGDLSAKRVEYELPPRSVICLDLDDVPEATRDEVRQRLEAQLTSVGHTVVPEGGRFTLTITHRQGKRQDYVYIKSRSTIPGRPAMAPRPFGPGFNGPFDEIVEKRNVSIAPAIVTAELSSLLNKSIWRVEANQLPPQLMSPMASFGFGTSSPIPSDQSIEQYIQSIETPAWPKVQFNVPESIEKAGGRQTPVWGRVEVTPTGFKVQ